MVTAGRAHPGQWTANRCVFCGAQYLELIYLASREDAAANPVRLDRRVDWRKTGASPFRRGIPLPAFRRGEERFKW